MELIKAVVGAPFVIFGSILFAIGLSIFFGLSNTVDIFEGIKKKTTSIEKSNKKNNTCRSLKAN
jgi:5-bromo-4-chloroindolyl phosphate hydrolysis protein